MLSCPWRSWSSFGFEWSFGDAIKPARKRLGHRALGLLRSAPGSSVANCQVITISGHDVEARVASEIAEVTGGQPIREQHIGSLRYTQQVIQEAMRLYPPAAMIVREARGALRLGAETIEPGATVYVPVYAVHRHEAFWDRPDVFDPDRFAREAVKLRNRYVYLPFGAGPRICIGMGFAQMEATSVLAVLLASVRLRLRPGYVPKPTMRAALRPAGGMPMRLFRRISNR